MEKQNFENSLKKMNKPEINELRHTELLSRLITNAKDKSVVSWWWICIPLFMLFMLTLKSIYMPGTSLISNLNELKSREMIMSLIFFLITPVILIVINAMSILKIHRLSGNPGIRGILEYIWFNLLNIGLSLFVLIVYLV